MSQPVSITGDEKDPLLFSVLTLMTRPEQYREMLASFRAGGFDGPDTEYLLIDNSLGNRHDAYCGLRALIAQARGTYLILAHQDLLLLKDGMPVLRQRLSQLDAIDPHWAVAGNSGLTAGGTHYLRISDPHGDDQARGPFPARVDSLDENFLVLRRAAMISPSVGPTGFHFYGADLCLQAKLKGMKCYVIDFHLRHLSGGKIDKSFEVSRDALERAYHARLRGGLLHTTCDLLVVTASNPRFVFGRIFRRILRRMRKY